MSASSRAVRWVKQALGRDIDGVELTSLNVWMKVDEAEEKLLNDKLSEFRK